MQTTQLKLTEIFQKMVDDKKRIDAYRRNPEQPAPDGIKFLKAVPLRDSK